MMEYQQQEAATDHGELDNPAYLHEIVLILCATPPR
jgi:hypothetical protein